MCVHVRLHLDLGGIISISKVLAEADGNLS